MFYDILIKKKLAAASGGASPDAAADINIRRKGRMKVSHPTGSSTLSFYFNIPNISMTCVITILFNV